MPQTPRTFRSLSPDSPLAQHNPTAPLRRLPINPASAAKAVASGQAPWPPPRPPPPPPSCRHRCRTLTRRPPPCPAPSSLDCPRHRPPPPLPHRPRCCHRATAAAVPGRGWSCDTACAWTGVDGARGGKGSSGQAIKNMACWAARGPIRGCGGWLVGCSLHGTYRIRTRVPSGCCPSRLYTHKG